MVSALIACTITSAAQAQELVAAYADASVENSLNVGDYDSATKLLNIRVKQAARGSLQEAYLRTALMESWLWQGQLKEALSESKRALALILQLQKNKDGAEAAMSKALYARFLDSQSWLLEELGQEPKCAQALDEAIALLKGQNDADISVLVDCLSHKASLEAQEGDFEQARQLLEQSIATSSGVASISSFTVADLEEALAGVLYKMGRTADSQVHFAKAYAVKQESDALIRRFAPHPYWLSPDYRFIEGAPWSSRQLRGGVEERAIDAGAVRVSASIARDKDASNKTVRVCLTVTNKSGQAIEFLGRAPELTAVNPRLVVGNYLDPKSLADTVETKATKKAESIRSDGRNATRQVTTVYPTLPYQNGRGRQGFFRSLLSDSGNTGYTRMPDFQAEAEAMQKAQKVEEKGHAVADAIRTQAIGAGNIAAGGVVSGYLYFDMKAPRDASDIILKIPVGDAVFEFRFNRLP